VIERECRQRESERERERGERGEREVACNRHFLLRCIEVKFILAARTARSDPIPSPLTY